MNNEKLAAQTGAATVDFTVHPGAPVVVSAKGLSGSEVVSIKRKRGASYDALITTLWPGPTGCHLSVAADTVTVSGPGEYQLDKPVTAVATSLHVN